MIFSIITQIFPSLSETLDFQYLGVLQQKQDGCIGLLQKVGEGGGVEESRTEGSEEGSGP